MAEHVSKSTNAPPSNDFLVGPSVPGVGGTALRTATALGDHKGMSEGRPTRACASVRLPLAIACSCSDVQSAACVGLACEGSRKPPGAVGPTWSIRCFSGPALSRISLLNVRVRTQALSDYFEVSSSESEQGLPPASASKYTTVTLLDLIDNGIIAPGKDVITLGNAVTISQGESWDLTLDGLVRGNGQPDLSIHKFATWAVRRFDPDRKWVNGWQHVLYRGTRLFDFRKVWPIPMILKATALSLMPCSSVGSWLAPASARIGKEVLCSQVLCGPAGKDIFCKCKLKRQMSLCRR